MYWVMWRYFSTYFKKNKHNIWRALLMNLMKAETLPIWLSQSNNRTGYRSTFLFAGFSFVTLGYGGSGSGEEQYSTSLMNVGWRTSKYFTGICFSPGYQYSSVILSLKFVHRREKYSWKVVNWSSRSRYWFGFVELVST